MLLACVTAAPVSASPNPNFPARDSLYHNYTELVTHIHTVAAAHPDIVRLFSIGTSYEGRPLWAAEVTRNPGTNEPKPEVLFDGLHHAVEYLGSEMTLDLLDLLTSHYGQTDAMGQRVTAIVNTRRIWIVFMVNPDGFEYTLGGHPYRWWRKNRQPNAGSTAIGTDLNRNYSYRWKCCGSGSTSNPGADDYPGPHPFSAPETIAMRDFIQSRVIDGRQQIRESVTFHTPGHLVLWPYGYTSKPVPNDMTVLDQQVLSTLGKQIAARNGYLPLQWGAGRRTSGSAIDWQYGTQRIFTFLIEMGNPGPVPDEQIAPEVTRNHDALLYFMEQADCPYRVIGKAAQYCGPYFDDFEINRGWRVNPDGTDTATDGAWQRGKVQADPYQLAGAVSGQGALATGRIAGHDVDGGTTTARSPVIHLPASTSSLHLRYWVGLGADATAGDGLSVQLVTTTGTILATLLTVSGDGAQHDPGWRVLNSTMPAASLGQDVAIQVQASDASADSTVEAGIDDVRVTTP